MLNSRASTVRLLGKEGPGKAVSVTFIPPTPGLVCRDPGVIRSPWRQGVGGVLEKLFGGAHRVRGHTESWVGVAQGGCPRVGASRAGRRGLRIELSFWFMYRGCLFRFT